MLRSVIALAAVASSSAFSLLPLRGGSTTPRSSPQMAEIGETGVAFETVAREWRCKDARALSLSLSLGESAVPRDLATHRDMYHETPDGQTAYSPRSLFLLQVHSRRVGRSGGLCQP